MHERELARRARHPKPAQEAVPTTMASHVVQLQRSVGNAAVQRLLQRRLWDNKSAKFQTKNDEGAANSEYEVTSTGYTRYAPVNIKRKILNQVYYKSRNRSFVYLTGMPKDLNTPEFDALYERGRVQSVVGGSVTFTSAKKPNSPPLLADIGPSEGAMVFDAQVDDDGRVTDPHVGHHVTALNQALPTLDDPSAHLEVQKKYRQF